MFTTIEHDATPTLSHSVVKIVVFIRQQLFIKAAERCPQRLSEAGKRNSVDFRWLGKARWNIEAILGVSNSKRVRNCNCYGAGH